MTTTLTTAQTSALVAMATAQQDAFTATELGATGSTMQALLRRGLVARATGWTSVLAYMQNAEYYTLTTAGREAVAYQLVLNEAPELGVNVSQDFEALYVEAPEGQVWSANNLHSLHAIVDAWSNTKQDSQEALADLWERMLDGLTDGPCEDITCTDCYPDAPAPVPAPWAGTVSSNFGTTVFELEAPLQAVDTVTGKPVLVTHVVDNHSEFTDVSQYKGFFHLVGQKQKKSGEFYGEFTTLTVPIPFNVKEQIAAHNKLRQHLSLYNSQRVTLTGLPSGKMTVSSAHN